MHTNSSTNVDTSLSSPYPIEIYDVVIVGAGPVGLATAIGLHQRGIENILVIDQTRSFRQVGQIIDLLPNGLKALRAIDFNAYEEVKKKGLIFSNPTQSNHEKTSGTTDQRKPPKTTRKWIQKNLKGEIIWSFSLNYEDWFKEYGEGRVSIAWYDLQTTLRHQLPQDRVKVNHRCINLVNEPELGCVRVDCVSDLGVEANPYAYWTDRQTQEDAPSLNSEAISQQLAKTSIRAKLVVAADGINSTVRRVLYTDSPYQAFTKPEYSGFAAVGCGEMSEIPNVLLTELQEKFFEDSPIVTILNDEISRESSCMESPRMMLFHRPGGSLGYVIHLPLPLEALNEMPGRELIDLAVQQLENADFPNVLKQLVRLSPLANLLRRPYYIHRATLANSLQLPSTRRLNTENQSMEIQPPWSAGRVVLVGDAAHGMPPFIAQGANQGLEDALTVVTLIANIRDKHHWDDMQAIGKAFEKYECLRRSFMVRIQKATLERFDGSPKEWEEYGQQVYLRNFDRVLEALL